MTFGTALDAELAQAEDKAKNASGAKRRKQNILDRWLTMPGEDRPVKGRFADPAARSKKASPSAQRSVANARQGAARD